MQGLASHSHPSHASIILPFGSKESLGTPPAEHLWAYGVPFVLQSYPPRMRRGCTLMSLPSATKLTATMQALLRPCLRSSCAAARSAYRQAILPQRATFAACALRLSEGRSTLHFKSALEAADARQRRCGPAEQAVDRARVRKGQHQGARRPQRGSGPISSRGRLGDPGPARLRRGRPDTYIW
jgi:hypothetical protein